MTLDDYVAEWEKDAPIPADKIDEVARTVPYLHAKWLRYHTTERLRFRKQGFEFATLYKHALEYYTNKMLDEDREKLGWPPNPRLVLSANINTYIEADPNIQKLAIARALSEETLKFLESVISAINRRGYDIKNTIDYLKWTQGV